MSSSLYFDAQELGLAYAPKVTTTMITTTTPNLEGRPIVEYLGSANGMLMVSASGTAVRLAGPPRS